MGYSVIRFKNAVSDQFICPICDGVLEDAITTPECEHIFCRACISKYLATNQQCPVDKFGVKEEDLRTVHRVLRTLLSELLINCNFAAEGCTVFVSLGSLKAHTEECEYNPNKLLPCEKICGLLVPKTTLKDHDCVQRMQNYIQKYKTELDAKDKQIETLKQEYKNKPENWDHTLAYTKLENAVQTLEAEKERVAKAWKEAKVLREDLVRFKFDRIMRAHPSCPHSIWFEKLPPVMEYFCDVKSVGHLKNYKPLLQKCGCPQDVQNQLIQCQCPESRPHKCGIEKVDDIIVRLRKIPKTAIYFMLRSENVHFPKEWLPEYGYIFRYIPSDLFD